MSFIFADLITFPLLLIYRRYYGIRLTLRMLAIFWVVMSLAGLVTEGIFRAAGLVPTNRSVAITTSHFSWDYTTYLNIRLPRPVRRRLLAVPPSRTARGRR